jgi:hypothetical protein
MMQIPMRARGRGVFLPIRRRALKEDFDGHSIPNPSQRPEMDEDPVNRFGFADVEIT